SFNDPPTPNASPLSLHDALPILRIGSSLRGLSEVITITSLSRPATAPINGRFVRSRSPPQPNTVMRRPGASGRAVSSRLRNASRSEEHTSELQSRFDLVCRLLLE